MEILHLNSMFSEPYLQNEFVNFKTSDECFKRFMPICHQFKEHQSIGIDIHLQKTIDICPSHARKWLLSTFLYSKSIIYFKQMLTGG